MSSDRPAPNYCADCGARLSEGASFCSQCGTPVSGSGSSPSRSAFRERVREYAVHGWEIERDYGDRVVARKREFGSIPAHVALFLLTGGVGNVLYAWYRYSPGASRVELRSDGTERWVDGRSAGGSLWDAAVTAAGVLLTACLFFSISAVVTQSVLVGATTFGLVLLAPLAYYLLTRRSDGHRSLTTVGRVRSIDETPTDDASRACVVCGGGTPGGVVREYAERFYVAGVPVWTVEEGQNRYCHRCAVEEDVGASAASKAPMREVA